MSGSSDNVINMAEWKEEQRRDKQVKDMLVMETAPANAPSEEVQAFTAAWIAEFEDVRDEIHCLLVELDNITGRDPDVR